MMATIIGMAQHFVGKNNINLLTPQGQFGTRLQGGDDAASPRYIFTNLAPIARKIFMKEDDDVLEYLEDEGKTIEPDVFAPIIPMVLVNGANGIATGWSTNLPMFDPLAVIDTLTKKINNEPCAKLVPWYRDFTGTIEKQDNSYITKGKWFFGQKNTLHITELPIGTWTEPFISKILKQSASSKSNLKNAIIKHADNSSDLKVNVVFTLSTDAYTKYSTNEDQLVKDFYLTTNLPMTNIHLLNENNTIQKYNDVESIIEAFMTFRLTKYEQRKAFLLKNLNETLHELTNKKKFIYAVIDGSIPLHKVKHEVTINAMNELNIGEAFHEKFLALALSSLNLERIHQLNKQIKRLERDLNTLASMSIQDMWLRDLEQLKQTLTRKHKTKFVLPNNAKVICIE